MPAPLRAAKPFVKWAGGKTALLSHLNEFVPSKFNRYCEVFVGGGAFFFNLAPQEAVLSDANPELINSFQVVQKKPYELIAALARYKNEESAFYRIRSQNPRLLSQVNRAARFIYLNKTCFNGLYRVNKSGNFNTPYAKNSTTQYIEEEALLAASTALKNAQIHCADFSEVVDSQVRTGDFIYFDPPYMPVSEFSNFKRYTPNQFGETDHVRLAEAFRKLDKMGCYVLLSNAHHPRVVELYKGFRQHTVMAPRLINCRGHRRGPVKELLIRNF